ncbi:MAG: sialidase family protein [Planctomycetota bacterium]|jgi:hypothetical protein
MTTNNLHPSKNTPVLNTNPGDNYSDSDRMYQGVPTIACASNGRLWVSWFGGGTWEMEGNYIMTATSDDDGENWSEIKHVIEPGAETLRCFDPCLWHDPTGRMWLFISQSFPPYPDKSAEWCTWAMHTDDSESENPEWTEIRFLFDGITLNKPTVLSSGEYLACPAVWHSLEGSARVYMNGTIRDFLMCQRKCRLLMSILLLKKKINPLLCI